LRLEKLPNGFYAEVPVDQGMIVVRYGKLSEKNDSLSGLLNIKLKAGSHVFKLYSGRWNCMSTRTRKDLANYLSRVTPKTFEIDWHEIIEWLAQGILEKHFSSSEVLRIVPTEHTEVEFLLYPILPKKHPTLIFAPGGTGKSFVAMYLAMLVQNGMSLLESTEAEQGEVLYLDWEVDYQEAQRRFGMLRLSFENQDLEFPLYKRCELTLKDEIDDILQAVAENGVKLVIIDSVAPAVGGDINDSHKVLNFFQAVRQITTTGASVMLLTHVSKKDKDEDSRSPIGSVFFENLSRLTWELRSEMFDDGIFDFALIPRKSNFGKLDPVGLRAVFKFHGVHFSKISADQVIQYEKEFVVYDLLKRLKSATVKEIANQLGMRKEKVYTILTKLEKRGKIYSEGEQWKVREVVMEDILDLNEVEYNG